MTKEFDLDITEDPEILDDEQEGQGGDEHYDGQAVQTIAYDSSQFEQEVEFEEDEDDLEYDEEDEKDD